MAKKNYTEEEERMARFAKAMGHPARMAILRFLAEQDMLLFRRHPRSAAYRQSDGIPAPQRTQRSRIDSRRNPTSESEILHRQQELDGSPVAVCRLLLGLC